MATTEKFTSFKTTKDIYLTNQKATDIEREWGLHEIKIEQGYFVGVRIQQFEDGRIYYTAFTEVKGVIFCRTDMKDVNGKLHLNCGGICAQQELEQHFKKIKLS